MFTRNLTSFTLPEEFFFSFLLGEIVAKLSKVDDPAHGGWAPGQPRSDRGRSRERAGELDAHDAHLLIGNPIDHTHLAGTDAFVDANICKFI